MIASVDRFIADHRLLSRQDKVLVSASGGPDSMVLLDLLLRLGYSCEVVHVNYRLRGLASDADAALVRDFCAGRSLRLTELDAGEQMAARPKGASVQAFAREIRYAHIAGIANRTGLGQVAVGHHRDDQVETVLMALLRRTGFDGLAGMRPRRPLTAGSKIALVRPLLGTGREEVLRYAHENAVPWRADASNKDRRYLRSRIRHHILPALVYAAGEGVITDVLAMAEAMRHVVDDVLPNAIPESVRVEAIRGGSVPLAPLMSMEQVLRSWLFLQYLRNELPGVPVRRSSVEAIERLLVGPNGKRVRFGRGSIWKERDRLRLVREREAPKGMTDASLPSVPVFIHRQSAADFATGRLVWEFVRGVPAVSNTEADEILVDADKLPRELRIRPWKAGDRFRPFGMHGSKKVKALLTERRIPSSRRAEVHVLCDEERIIWVIGHRMDERYKIDVDTQHVVRFRFESGAARRS